MYENDVVSSCLRHSNFNWQEVRPLLFPRLKCSHSVAADPFVRCIFNSDTFIDSCCEAASKPRAEDLSGVWNKNKLIKRKIQRFHAVWMWCCEYSNKADTHEFSTTHSDIQHIRYMSSQRFPPDHQEAVRHSYNCKTLLEWWVILVLGKETCVTRVSKHLHCIWMQSEMIILIYQKGSSQCLQFAFFHAGLKTKYNAKRKYFTCLIKKKNRNYADNGLTHNHLHLFSFHETASAARYI